MSPRQVTAFASLNCLSTLIVAVIALLLAGLSQARSDEPPRIGLLWNKTGLPLVFPLQVKTSPGLDYLIMLTNAETGEDALAAYAEGGAFFRVLAPPGEFLIRIEAGTDWRADPIGFHDADTQQSIELTEPLLFHIRGVGTKVGHLIDLTDSTDITISEEADCQTSRRTAAPPARLLDRDDFNQVWDREDQRLLPSLNSPQPAVPSDFPRLQPDPLARTGDRDLAYLRYRNGQPLYLPDPGHSSEGASIRVQTRPCP